MIQIVILTVFCTHQCNFMSRRERFQLIRLMKGNNCTTTCMIILLSNWFAIMVSYYQNQVGYTVISYIYRLYIGYSHGYTHHLLNGMIIQAGMAPDHDSGADPPRDAST